MESAPSKLESAPVKRKQTFFYCKIMKYTAGLKEIQDLKKLNNKPKTQTNKTDLIQEKETRKIKGDIL